MPKFSVIVPIYKVEKYIKQCMQSILNQTYNDFEVICVDDCGKDNSMKIVEKMAERDDRIIILHHEYNRGLSAARNTGFEIAKGEYTLFVDSDDWLELNCLEVINNYINQNPGINSIFFDAHKYSDNKHKIINDAILKNTPGHLKFTPHDMASSCDYAWIKAYKTAAIREKNLKFPEGLTFEDGEFFFKFFSIYPETFIISECLYFYREREGSIVTNAHKGVIKLEDIYQIVRNIKQFYVEENIYEEYKIALAILLTNRIRTCKNIRYQYEKSIKMSSELLNELGGIDEFKEFDRIQAPLVSVVVLITENNENVLKLINNLQNQNYIHVEIICTLCDNGENLYNTLKEIQTDDNRIVIISCNHSESYKAGLNSAKGKYILFVDSNDTIKQGYIKKAVEILNEQNTNFVIFNSQKENCNAQSGRFVVDDASLSVFPVDIHYLVFNRKYLLECGGFCGNNLIELCYKACINSKFGYYENQVFCTSDNSRDCQQGDIYGELKGLYDYLKINNLQDSFRQSYMKILASNIKEMHSNNKIEQVMELLDLSKSIINS